MEDEEAFCCSGENASLYSQDAGFLDRMSVEGYGQVRVRRQDKLSPMIRLNEGASLAREHIVLDGGKVAPEFCGKG